MPDTEAPISGVITSLNLSLMNCAPLYSAIFNCSLNLGLTNSIQYNSAQFVC
jgi:hypothetical protein